MSHRNSRELIEYGGTTFQYLLLPISAAWAWHLSLSCLWPWFLCSSITSPGVAKKMMEQIKLIECPRDAWQGLPEFIPTEYKAEYLKELVLAGFKHIDAVSFVSPKHVKQMADSEEVMAKYNASLPSGIEPPEIIGIVLNEKGLERALATPGVTTIGYPYSISAYFRRANANMTREESRKLVERLRKETAEAKRDLVIYISMAFGNPYDEPWGAEIVQDTLEWLKDIRVRTVSLADTAGNATPEIVAGLFRDVKDHVAGVELGVHLHSRPENEEEKILAAYQAGCRRFDSTLTGLGGCPFAGDNLVGNIATEQVLAALRAPARSQCSQPDCLPQRGSRQAPSACCQSAGILPHRRQEFSLPCSPAGCAGARPARLLRHGPSLGERDRRLVAGRPCPRYPPAKRCARGCPSAIGECPAQSPAPTARHKDC